MHPIRIIWVNCATDLLRNSKCVASESFYSTLDDIMDGCRNDSAWYRENELIAIVQKSKSNNKMCAKNSKQQEKSWSRQHRRTAYTMCTSFAKWISSHRGEQFTIANLEWRTRVRSPILFIHSFSLIYTCLLAGIFLFCLHRIRMLYRWLGIFLAAFLVNGLKIDATQYITFVVSQSVCVQRYTWLYSK